MKELILEDIQEAKELIKELESKLDTAHKDEISDLANRAGECLFTVSEFIYK